MSEFRQDPVSGDWVIMAPERSKRPDQLSPKRLKRVPAPKRSCPFEFGHLAKSDQWPPIFPRVVNKATKIVVVPNKYPIVTPMTTCRLFDPETLYRSKEGGGVHNLLITRDHMKNFADLDAATARDVFRVLQEQYRDMRTSAGAKYVSGFFNWGGRAGASLWHPHYQILSLPVLPPHVYRSLHGAKKYFEKNKRCVRCDVLKTERKLKKRIIAENRNAIALARFASKTPFEVNVIPKPHLSFFEESSDVVIRDVVALVQLVMRRLKVHLNDPDLNFFIHSAPIDGGAYPYHHWHVEIIPKLTTPAGLEFSTEIYANIIDPDAAARILRR